MKLGLIAAASVAVLAVGSGTATAQDPILVPHRGHYHVVPTYSPQIYSGYAYPAYSPGVVGGGYYATPGFGGYYSYPRFGYGSNYGPSWGGHGHHHHGHHHHHHHHGHHHHR